MSDEKVLKPFFAARDRVDVVTSVRDSEKVMVFLLKYASPGFSWYVDVGRDRVSFSLKRTRPADEVNGNGNGE